MEQLALDYKKQIDALFVQDQDKEELYDALQRYNEKELDITQLVRSMRRIVSHPQQLVLFDHSRCLIRHEDQQDYEEVMPRFSLSHTKSVLLSAVGKEKIGLSVRGGLEHSIGIFVVEVEQGSPAERCGISVGDEILLVNGYNVKFCTHKEAINLISRNKTMLAIKMRHAGMFPVPIANTQTFQWAFADKDFYDVSNKEGLPDNKQEKSKMVFVERDGNAALGFNVVDTKSGVYVSYVRDKSPADEAGVVAGDEILAVNDLKLRKATTPEIVCALKRPGKLRMVLRPAHGPHNKTSRSVSLNFSESVSEDCEDDSRIEERIDELFQSNLAKKAEEIHHNIQQEDKNEVASNVKSAGTECVNKTVAPLPPSPPPPPPPPPAPMEVEADVHPPASPLHDTISQASEFPPLPSDLDSLIDADTRSLPIVPNDTAGMETKQWQKLSIDRRIYESNEERFSNSTQESNSYWRERLRRISHRRQQKLEAELRERLKIERQKRLAQEKCVRLHRIRQELKETEREEARLQKLLAEPENNDDIQYSVGRYGYPTTTAESVKGFSSSEFNLTTPLNMVNNQAKKPTPHDAKEVKFRPVPSTIPHTGRFEHNAVPKRSSVSVTRYEKEVDGKRVVISEMNENQVKSGIEISRRSSDVRGMDMALMTTPLNNHLISSRQIPYSFARVNTVNEITFF